MSDPGGLDQTFHFIMQRRVETGQYAVEMLATMIEIGGTGPFWQQVKP